MIVGSALKIHRRTIAINKWKGKESAVYYTNQTKKMKRAKQNKNRWAIKSRNGHENPWDPSEKV